MSNQRERKLSAAQAQGTPSPPRAQFINSILPPERNPIQSTNAVFPGAIELRHLMGSKEIVDSLDPEESASSTQIMRLSCMWAKFLRGATFEEAESSMPFFNRFVDSVSRFSSQTGLFSANICISALENLIHREPVKISNALAMLLESETRPEAREAIVSILEKNLAFILDPRCLFALGELLKEYENGPDSFNPSVAMAASAFLFSWKDNVMLEKREGLLAYAIAWAHTIEESHRISLMHEVVLRGKGEATEILARAADMSVFRSQIQDEAIDLLVRMGVQRYSFTGPQGQRVEARMVNMLLEQRILEGVMLALGEGLVGKTVLVGSNPYIITDPRQYLQ